MTISNPTPIANTVIGTSDPCNICHGISLFGTGGTPVPLGVSHQLNFPRINGTAGLGGNMVQASIQGGMLAFFGICGPSWAFRANGVGNYGPSTTAGTNEIDLAITADNAQAGFVFGFDITFELEVEAYLCVNSQCIEPYRRSTFSIDLDVLGIALEVIQQALETGALFEATTDTLPSIKKSWGAFANATGIVKNGGSVQLSPTFTVPINLWPLLVALDASSGTFSGALVAADGVLKDLKGSVMIGPTIGVGVTSTIAITGLTLDNVTLSSMSYNAGSSTAIATGTPALPAAPTKVGIALNQTPTFNLTLGVEFQLTLLEIFSTSMSAEFSITELLGIQIQLGTYNNTLSNTIGSPSIVADLGLEYDVAFA